MIRAFCWNDPYGGPYSYIHTDGFPRGSYEYVKEPYRIYSHSSTDPTTHGTNVAANINDNPGAFWPGAIITNQWYSNPMDSTDLGALILNGPDTTAHAGYMTTFFTVLLNAGIDIQEIHCDYEGGPIYHNLLESLTGPQRVAKMQEIVDTVGALAKLPFYLRDTFDPNDWSNPTYAKRLEWDNYIRGIFRAIAIDRAIRVPAETVFGHPVKVTNFNEKVTKFALTLDNLTESPVGSLTRNSSPELYWAAAQSQVKDLDLTVHKFWTSFWQHIDKAIGCVLGGGRLIPWVHNVMANKQGAGIEEYNGPPDMNILFMKILYAMGVTYFLYFNAGNNAFSDSKMNEALHTIERETKVWNGPLYEIGQANWSAREHTVAGIKVRYEDWEDILYQMQPTP